MNQKKLSGWLKFIIICMGIIGIGFYFVGFPLFDTDLAEIYPEYGNCFWPWIIFIWLTGIPCYMVLGYGWKIADSIGSDQSFSVENAGRLKKISYLATGDAVAFLAGNLVFAGLNMSSGAVLILSFLISFAGIAAAVATAALSCLVMKAAVLQEQNDLTI